MMYQCNFFVIFLYVALIFFAHVQGCVWAGEDAAAEVFPTRVVSRLLFAAGMGIGFAVSFGAAEVYS